MMISVVAFLLGASSPADMRPIHIPYQIIPALQAYTDCVLSKVEADSRSTSVEAEEVRRANADALAACRNVREAELDRALKLQTDDRLYGSRAAAQAAVRQAFDRFDSDYDVQPSSSHSDKQ